MQPAPTQSADRTDEARPARIRRLFGRLATASLVLTFMVIIASAFLRHTQAGLGCADWPACYGRVAADAQAVAPSLGVHLARLLHRLAASSALLLIVALLWLGKGVAGFRRERAFAVLSLAIALGLAALGLFTPGAQTLAVPLGNLLGGFLMLAVLAALAGHCGSNRHDAPLPAPTAPRVLVPALLAAVLVEALLGGLIGTQFALQACPALDRCAAAGDAFAGIPLNPFRQPVIVASHVVAPAGAAGIHLLHRAAGVGIALGALWLAFALRRSDPRSASLLAALALAAPLLGATAILLIPALAVTVLHNAAAAALIATLAYLAVRSAPR
jgi:cytochrome c oxidase assembly protein subunit 15